MVINIMVPDERLSEFRAKDRLSALTHFAGFIISIIATPVLIIKGALDERDAADLISFALFTLSMVLLYGASASYHAFGQGKDMILKKLDHMMIAVLIAGTYTPLCVTTLRENGGMTLLAVIWSLAFLSIFFKAFRVTCPRFVSSLIYIAMGWACTPYLKALRLLLAPDGYRYLLLGGIIYTAGGIIYAVKIPLLERNREFRSHELFHIFILLGTAFHYMMVYTAIA